ncbi:hypothetical protein JCM6882_006640 [Rhodosporidiobolus microsporus]
MDKETKLHRLAFLLRRTPRLAALSVPLFHPSPPLASHPTPPSSPLAQAQAKRGMTTYGSPKQEYISADEVADLVLANPKRDDFLVIDVRSSDFAGGNLPGAVNITTGEFRDEKKLDRLIAKHISSRPSLRLLILHCMRSQTRGPYAASLLSQAPSLPSNVRVVVLEGGFQGWYRRFKGRAEMFEGLEEGEREEWERVVQADEGDKGEAEDSRRLRAEQGR